MFFWTLFLNFHWFSRTPDMNFHWFFENSPIFKRLYLQDYLVDVKKFIIFWTYYARYVDCAMFQRDIEGLNFGLRSPKFQFFVIFQDPGFAPPHYKSRNAIFLSYQGFVFQCWATGLVRVYFSQSSKLYGVLDASEHRLYAFLSRFDAICTKLKVRWGTKSLRPVMDQ